MVSTGSQAGSHHNSMHAKQGQLQSSQLYGIGTIQACISSNRACSASQIGPDLQALIRQLCSTPRSGR